MGQFEACALELSSRCVGAAVLKRSTWDREPGTFCMRPRCDAPDSVGQLDRRELRDLSRGYD